MEKWKNLTMKSLKAKLCGLREVEVPEGLKDRLLDSARRQQIELCRGHSILWRPRALWVGTAAAVIFVLGLTLVPHISGPSVPSQNIIMDLNDRPGRYISADQNNTAAPNKLQWSTTSHNEPAYTN